MTQNIFTLIFFSILFGIGIFMIVISPNISNTRNKKSSFHRAVSQANLAEKDVYLAGDSFLTDTSKRGLEKSIAQAGLPITKAEFIRGAALIAIVTGSLVLSLIGGAIFVALFLSVVSVVLYVRWLFSRRDLMSLEYDEALAQACDFMGAGARRSNTTIGAVEHAIPLVRPILKEDFEFIHSQLSSNATIDEAFGPIQEKRQSQALDIMVETLKGWQSYGAKNPLAEILRPLRLSVQKIAATRRKVDAELSNPKRSMIIVAVAPFVYVIMLRLASPAYARYFASPQGEIVQIVAYSISLIGVLIGERRLSSVTKIIEVDRDL